MPHKGYKQKPEDELDQDHLAAIRFNVDGIMHEEERLRLE
jgi:hypothetical protein